MKRLVVVGVVIVVFVVGCASFETNTKNAIGVTGITYNQSMKAAADLEKQGKIDDKQWAYIEEYATKVFVAYNTTIDSFVVYMNVKSADAKVKVEVLLTDMATALAKLEGYVATLQGGKK